MIPTSQPRGLYLLFFTEMWERFGFYTLQTIIILYMSRQLGFSDDHAYMLYGTFSSIMYLTPVLGGYIADRFIGFQRAIIVGGSIFAMGYLACAFPGEWELFTGMSLLIVANGLFKPNVSSIVGALYEAGDPRRDGGFTLFYMGINIGSLIPPLIVGTLVKVYGWHAGFLLAASGMLISLITFYIGRSRLGVHGLIPQNSLLRKALALRFGFNLTFFLGLVALTAVCFLLFQYPGLTNLVVIAATVIVIGVVLTHVYKEHPVRRKKMIACLILIVISMGFWALYNQTFTSLMLYADRNMTKHFLGIPIDAESTQFFNPFFIIVLSPVLNRLWVWLANRNLNPSTPMKFALGVFFMALGFLVLALGDQLTAAHGMSPAGWLVTSYFLQTVGELFISPIGMAMVTRLSPTYLVGMMMGVWFSAQAASFAIGGSLAMLANIPKHLNVTQSLVVYDHAFTVFGSISMSLAIIAFICVPFLKRMMGTGE